MRTLLGEQPLAYESIRTWLMMSGGGMHLLTGCAGTGKSFLLIDIADFMKTRGKVIVTSPTHKSLRVLKKFIGSGYVYSTIHSALGMKEYIDHDGVLSFRRDAMSGCPADNYTHIIVDEASMLNDVIFDELVNMSDQGKKVLFVGDPLQIPPVRHENALPFDKNTQIEFNIGVSRLETVLRQALESPILAYATNIRADIHKPIQILNPQGLQTPQGSLFFIKQAEKHEFFRNIMLPLYKSLNYERDLDYVKCIAWTNYTVNFHNKIIREFLFGENLPKILVGDKLIMDAPVIEDRKILISTNEEALVTSVEVAQEVMSEEYTLKYYKTTVRVYDGGIFNEYSLRIIHEDSEKIFDKLCQLQTALAKSYRKGSYEAKSAWIDLYAFKEFWHQVKYSYCITAHKSQSSTYNTAVVLEYDIKVNRNTYEANRIFYTACTRPSDTLYVVY